ncbi:hypothetical protein D9M68_769330 [compost metagenome]
MASLISSMAEAPSLICEALPAVTFQPICGKRSLSSSLRNEACSVPSFSTEVPGRMVSSCSTTPLGVLIGRISRRKAPLSRAAAASSCERAE